MKKNIQLKGVKQNNLKGVDVEIPLGSFTVICGPSGSGKSSLAFETLYAEGQRRYIESLSNYTKQFLNKAPKPDLESVENIPPAISIEQKNGVKSSRSTVGTTTEVVDYLRLLFEKAGKAYCPEHHIPLEKDSVSHGTHKVLSEFNGNRGYVLAPIFTDGRILTGRKLLEQLKKDGYLRIYKAAKDKVSRKKASKKKTSKKKSTKKVLSELRSKDGNGLPQKFFQQEVGEALLIDDLLKARRAAPKEDFFILVDRISISNKDEARLRDSLTQAYAASLKYNKSILHAEAQVISVDGRSMVLSEAHSCSICGYKFPDINSRLFSFNSPVGACETCNGFGNILLVDEDKVIPNPELSINQGALKPFAMPSSKSDKRELRSFCKKAKINMDTPWYELPQKARTAIWEGTEDFYGVIGFFDYLERKKYKMHVRVFLARHKSPFTCPSCNGSRLKKEAQQVLIEEHTITDLSAMSIENLLVHVQKISLSPEEQEVCSEVMRQLHSRLLFLCDVGVGYLTLDRPTKTLSGGEYQRLMLSNQLGMALSQTLYVLDEPTVGLHPRDNDRLIVVLKQLRALGNTLVIVEHDHDVILNSSNVIEMGPGSGHLGGEVIFSGDCNDFLEAPESNTAFYLNPKKNWTPLPEPRPVDLKNFRYTIEMSGCSGNNLQGIDFQIPLNRFVTVTGVSGSGKSSLISQTLYPALARKLKVEYKQGLPYDDLRGEDYIKNVLFIDQSPIGKTARSNPVTYMKVYDSVRTLMAATSEARAMGYTPGTFSLNVDGGRCPVCKGLGFEVIDMMFMDDIHIPCDACDGKKFRPEILEVKLRKKNIYEILSMTVAEAMDFFVAYPNIRRPLSILKEVGLEYLQLGQSANSLSGGESQRLKIAKEFNSTKQQATLYILDEPTTGLHFREVHLLLKILNRLIESGGSVLLIEHNLEIIKHSDYIIDLGPEAGLGGGRLVAAGTPSEIMKCNKSHTGRYLKEYCEELGQKKRSAKTDSARAPL